MRFLFVFLCLLFCTVKAPAEEFQFGDFIPDRVRNGDEITSGLWVSPDAGVVRAILTA